VSKTKESSRSFLNKLPVSRHSKGAEVEEERNDQEQTDSEEMPDLEVTDDQAEDVSGGLGKRRRGDRDS
jgi:hypothetical protein